jgi:hypothetical protein
MDSANSEVERILMADLPAVLGNVDVLAAVTPGGLPYPVSSDPANQGANDIKALALALDPKVSPVIIAQSVPQKNLTQGATNQWTLSGIPTGVLVAISGSVVMRMNQAQYTVLQLFDGAVNVTGDMAFSSPATGGAVNILGNLTVIGYKFTTVPILKTFASSTGQSQDAITIRGIAWG